MAAGHNPNYTELFNAVDHSDLEKARRLLEHGAAESINEFHLGTTPLLRAVEHNYI